MLIKINFNMCDNSPECSALSVCPTQAIFWNEHEINALGEKGSLCVDNNKCISCGLCIGEDGCPIGAIVDLESSEIVDNPNDIDIEQIRALFVERYGAEPIDEAICISNLSSLSNLDDGITIVENFSETSIQCLLHSIPATFIVEKIKELTNEKYVRYFKRMVESESEEILPSLSIYRGKAKIAQVNGYFDESKKNKLYEKFSEMI